MLEPVAWGRAALTGAALLVCAGACDSVLGIEEPQDRPTDGGEAGEPASGGGTNPSGGSSGFTPAEAGAAGMPEVFLAGDGGEGGEPPLPECEADAARCGGENQKTPEVCDETGHFVDNGEECPVLCAGGKCTECEDGVTRCTPCSGGDTSCNPNRPQTCKDGAWTNDDTPCANLCNGGGCEIPASCAVASDSRSKCNGGSCCESLLVPGGEFKRDFDEEVSSETNLPAKISPFFLDRLEVTVGRMKQFVKSYGNIQLNNGDGKSDNIAADEGWNTAYDMPIDGTVLTAMLNCTGASWSDTEENVRLAVNCVSFNVAYAFCIWDGGRLPTDTEWNFAASGGDEQRTYVWGDLDLSPDHGYFAETDRLLPTTVGSWPKGNGRWGHADLSGNVSEWVLDYYYADLPEGLCEDCLAADPSNMRAYRGNAFTADAENQYVVYRGGGNEPHNAIGFRCARDLK